MNPATTASITEKRPSIFKRIPMAFVSFFKSLFALLVSIVTWLRYEPAYWFHLFLYTSRQFLRLEGYLSVAGAVLFYGYIITNDLVTSQRALLDYSYIYFSVVMVLMSMNLLPRERDQRTLEILWSQPMRRSSLILIQMTSLTVWIMVLCGFSVLLIQQFTAYPEGAGYLLLYVGTSSIAVGALTVLISTFTRHAIATALVALLVLGVHYYWIRAIGPLEIFANPIPLPGTQSGGSGDFSRYGRRETGISIFDVAFNRIALLVVTGFIFDYLFRRLRRTAEWFV